MVSYSVKVRCLQSLLCKDTKQLSIKQEKLKKLLLWNYIFLCERKQMGKKLAFTALFD